jgi:dihydroflavonol-4-reductase
MRALVTGATGCVGANIVEALLTHGYQVRALRRISSRLDALDGLQPEWAWGNVTDEPSLREAMAGCDWVFHAAAISQYWRNRPDQIYTVNVGGTRKVLSAARACGIQRIVYTSSVAVLGRPHPRCQWIDETGEFNHPPQCFHYGHSKLLAEAEIQRAVAAGQDVVIVNPTTVIGQRDIYFVGGEILRAARQGLTRTAPPGGMGVVSARAAGLGHLLAAEQGRRGERYILNGENVTHRELLEIIADVTGAPRPLLTLPQSAMEPLAWIVAIWNRLRRGTPLIEAEQLRLSAQPMYFDGRKAWQELKFPQIPARAAIHEAWRWYQDHHLL